MTMGLSVGGSLPASCRGCVMEGNGRCGKFQGTEGKGRLGVLLVGDWGSDGEAATGLPFRPRSEDGAALEGVLRRMGRERDDFVVANLLRCRPPYQEFAKDPRLEGAVDHCLENLRKVVREREVKVVVAFGDVVTAALTGLKGYKQGVKDLRGYLVPSVLGVPVVPTFHPRRLARGGTNLTALVMRDLSRATVAAVRGDQPTRELEELVRVETGMEGLEEIWRRLEADPKLELAYDIETQESASADDETGVVEFNRDPGLADPELVELGDDEDGDDEEPEVATGGRGPDLQRARIITVQFAVDEDWGVSVRWNEETVPLIKKILGSENPKIAHNGEMFDRPILKRHGVEVRGVHYDTLVAFRNLQPELPAGLQNVVSLYWPEAPPWKHLSGTNLEAYGVMDVVSLVRIWPRMKADLEKLRGEGMSAWEGYDVMTRPFREVLDQMAGRGIPVAKERLDGLEVWLREKAGDVRVEMQDVVPPELTRRHPVGGFANWPPEMKERGVEMVREVEPGIFEPTVKTYKNGKTREVAAKWTAQGLYKRVMRGEWPQVRRQLLEEFPDFKIGQFGSVMRLYVPVPFNSGSSKQMIEYLKLRGLPVPKRFKDGKETTSDREMERLWIKTKDPLVGFSRELRALDKLRSSYTGKLGEDGRVTGGWQPGPDGRLRATVGYTATWQLAAKNPNVMTLPKRRKDLAQKFRDCVRAEEGHTLVEIDYTAFHAKTLGLEARSARYMRLAALDIHSYVTGHLVKWPGIETALDLGDEELKGFLDEIKSVHKAVRDFKAKPSILGIGFGMGVRRLFYENRDSFAGESEARRLMDLIRGLFPEVFEWQERVVEEAKKGYLISRWGAVRRMMDVKRWQLGADGWREVQGKGAEKAKAFLPANDAHGMLRWKLLEMHRRGWLEKFELVNIVHDAVVFHPKVELAEECVNEVGRLMLEPVKQLADPVVAPDGFMCGAEASMGPTLAELKVVEIGG